VTKEFNDFSKPFAAHVVYAKDKERYWKRILIVDDEADITTTFKIGIENNNINSDRRIAVFSHTLMDSSYLKEYLAWISMSKSATCPQEK
jgi:hypothetical protein